MRMWMVHPRLMCQKHLCGEHVELHMFVGSINKGLSMQGYVDNNLLEPLQIFERHAAIAEEMERRGYNHKSPLPPADIYSLPHAVLTATVDKRAAQEDLRARCKTCANLMALEEERLAWA